MHRKDKQKIPNMRMQSDNSDRQARTLPLIRGVNF